MAIPLPPECGSLLAKKLMTTNLLRTEANERVDKGDFDYLADGAVQAEHRQVMGEMFTDPTRLRAWILDGFAIDCPNAKEVRVTRGRAILSQRVAGEVKHGVLVTGGDATKTVDIGAFGAGTYGIYVRFELVSGDLQSRIFWNPIGNGFEYGKTIATRYQANWSLRVEVGSPGAEWLKIGDVDRATLTPSTPPDTGITDQREFYYEGSINQKEIAANFTWNGTTTIAATGGDTTEMAVGDFIGVKADGQLFEITAETPNVDLTIDNSSDLTIPNGPAGAKISFMDDSAPAPYASGWSTDGGAGGSTADDRKNDRKAYGVADAQMFTAAIRQCLEDIKGRGLRRWWERDIGGINVGFDTDPTENKVAVGDTDFSLWLVGGTPYIQFDSDASFQFIRGTPELALTLGGVLYYQWENSAFYTTQTVDLGKAADKWPNIYGTIFKPGIADDEGCGDHWNPVDDDTFDLGSTSRRWRDARIDGIAYIDTLHLSTVAGEGISSDMLPTIDNTYNLGSSTYGWKNIFLSSVTPSISFFDSGGAADEDWWQFHLINGSFSLRALTDVFAAPVNLFDVTRTGATSGSAVMNVWGQLIATKNSGYAAAPYVPALTVGGTNPFILITDEDPGINAAHSEWGILSRQGGIGDEAFLEFKVQDEAGTTEYTWLTVETESGVVTEVDYITMSCQEEIVLHAEGGNQNVVSISAPNGLAGPTSNGDLGLASTLHIGGAGTVPFVIQGLAGANARLSTGFVEIWVNGVQRYVPYFDYHT
ncbi:MAG: hypothetical protein KAT58_10505 [candidate division Zixibacteria bacterium]|nr:hypothetical protein [candidate division Zixibacteria bacterium]